MSSPSGFLCASLVLGLATAGCSAPVMDEEDIADANEGVTQGVVLVERIAAVDGAQTNVSAKFLRLSASADPEAAERVVGSRLDLPGSFPGCVVLGGEEASSLPEVGTIVLLDAGDDVALRTGDQVIPLDRRAFPDVGGAVFGQFYTSRDVASALPAPAKYVLESSGSSEIDRLSLAADAPASPEAVFLAHQALLDDVVLPAGAPTVVRWRTGVGGVEGQGDLVYVDVASMTTGLTVRCAFPDTGEGVVSGSLLTQSTLGSLPAAVTVSVHRIRERALSANELEGVVDAAEMRFDLGVVGHAVVVADAP